MQSDGGDMHAGMEEGQEAAGLRHFFPDGSHGLGDPHSDGFQEEGKKRRGQYLKI